MKTQKAREPVEAKQRYNMRKRMYLVERCTIFGGSFKKYIAKNLSEYAGAFKDGSEIISEVFSDVFGSDNPSEFSLMFMEECTKIKEKRM